MGTTLRIWIPAGLGWVDKDRRRWIERKRDLTASQAVTSERARIASELHDVVAHSIGVMIVQAGGGRAVRDRELSPSTGRGGQVDGGTKELTDGFSRGPA